MISLTILYKEFFSGPLYESSAVLYYPSEQSAEIQEVSSRDLMDDAIAVMQQEKMLCYVSDEAGTSWESIQAGLMITGDKDSGVIIVTCQMSSGQLAYNCVQAVVKVFCEKLPGIVPIGELIILTNAKIPEHPLHTGWSKSLVLAAGTALLVATVSAWVSERRKCS